MFDISKKKNPSKNFLNKNSNASARVLQNEEILASEFSLSVCNKHLKSINLWISH